MKKRIAKKMSRLVSKYKAQHPEEFSDHYVKFGSPIVVRQSNAKLLCCKREFDIDLYERLTKERVSRLLAESLVNSEEFQRCLKVEVVSEGYSWITVGASIYFEKP